MDYFNMGAIHFNDLRLDPSLSTGSFNRNVTATDFAALLERTIGENTTAENPVPGSGNSKIDKNDRLYQLCLELETFLVKNLLSSMRNTVQKSGLIEQGFAGKMYEDMLYDEYAKDFTKSAGFGLAEKAYLQLKAYG